MTIAASSTILRAKSARDTHFWVFVLKPEAENSLMIYPWIGRDATETERLREKNLEACAAAEKLYKEWIYKAVDRARFLPLLEAMCCKLEREWNELIQGLNERSKILKEASSFWEGRDNFQWQCDAWIRHMQDLLEACHRRTGFESTTDYETLAINAEEFCTMCHQLHKSVASSGKKLLAFLQDTTDDDKRIKVCWSCFKNMSASVIRQF